MKNQQNFMDLICKNYINHGDQERDFTNLPRPFYTVVFLLEGRMECIEGDRRILVHPGEVVFLPLHLRYILRWSGERSATISCHFLLLPGRDLFAKKVVPLQKLSGEEFQEDFAFILEYSKDPEQALCVLGRFYSMLDRIYRRLSSAATPRMDDRVAKAVDYIAIHFDRPFSVETLAALCHMSPSRFYYCFKREVGCSPIEYKNKIAAQRAAALLISRKNISIEEIAAETGFASATYFRRTFKAIFGQTPREYRKAMAESF